jgi:hypothetical protein
MRTYGRVSDVNGIKTWIVVQTDGKGYNDYVYLTGLVQDLKLNFGESPFHADHGIPAKTSLLQQTAPTQQVAFLQSYWSKFFASLIIVDATDHLGNPATPTYDVSIIRKSGSVFQTRVAT